MPIDYKKYPDNWKSEIRPRILKRAKNKCEFCGVENHSNIVRLEYDNKDCYYYNGCIYDGINSEKIGCGFELLKDIKPIKIVLTIAHLNHDIKDNNDNNLKALCQRCHLRYDAKHHAESRKKNRNERKNN